MISLCHKVYKAVIFSRISKLLVLLLVVYLLVSSYPLPVDHCVSLVELSILFCCLLSFNWTSCHLSFKDIIFKIQPIKLAFLCRIIFRSVMFSLYSLKVPERCEKCLWASSSFKGKPLPIPPSGSEWAMSKDDQRWRGSE